MTHVFLLSCHYAVPVEANELKLQEEMPKTKEDIILEMKMKAKARSEDEDEMKAKARSEEEDAFVDDLDDIDS